MRKLTSEYQDISELRADMLQLIEQFYRDQKYNLNTTEFQAGQFDRALDDVLSLVEQEVA
jgi:hypothetical protein